MPTAAEMETFLAQLNERRDRLLRLIQVDGAGSLSDEVYELAEQLAVADEELRVQQEELSQTRERLAVLERRSLRLGSTQPQVVTDLSGLVLETNRAADQLVLRPTSRVSPRPIVAWFDVPHRQSVRSLISLVEAGGDQASLRCASIRRSDGSLVPVSVAVTRLGEAGNAGRLRWELRLTAGSPAAEIPGRPEPGAEGRVPLRRATEREWAGRGLVIDLTVAAEELAAASSEAQVTVAALAAARLLVPSATRTALEPAQTAAAARWAGGMRMPVRMEKPDPLHLVVEGSGERFEQEASTVVPALAVLVRAALDRLRSEEHLRVGMRRRQCIGQAVGIMVERYRITPEEAFGLLVKVSNDRNIKVYDIARVMVETGQHPTDVRAP